MCWWPAKRTCRRKPLFKTIKRYILIASNTTSVTGDLGFISGKYRAGKHANNETFERIDWVFGCRCVFKPDDCAQTYRIESSIYRNGAKKTRTAIRPGVGQVYESIHYRSNSGYDNQIFWRDKKYRNQYLKCRRRTSSRRHNGNTERFTGWTN